VLLLLRLDVDVDVELLVSVTFRELPAFWMNFAVCETKKIVERRETKPIPKCSMYGIFTHHKNKPNVDKYISYVECLG